MREYAVTADRRSHEARKPGTVIRVRKLASAEFPKAGSTAICVCHRQAAGEARQAGTGRTRKTSDIGIVGPYGSGRSRGSSQWGAAEPRPSR